MHYFLLGPSGVGKTRFGNWLEGKRKRPYDHIRVDNGDQGSELQKELRLWENCGCREIPRSLKRRHYFLK